MVNSHASKERAHESFMGAVHGARLGDIVAAHQNMILAYYKDVQDQANKSFEVARNSAILGFAILTFSVFYDAAAHALIFFRVIQNINIDSPHVSYVGLISSALVEFISAVGFSLYAMTTRQFDNFHDCLERTHRYLIAFRMSEEIGSERDNALQELVSVMANAPTISSRARLRGNKPVGAQRFGGPAAQQPGQI